MKVRSICAEHGEQNIGRWTKFCDPLKKKNGMNSQEGISWEKINGIQEMYHNNSNNLGATFLKLFEKIQYFITKFIDIW